MSFFTRIQNKKDTLANWVSQNPVLLDGEIALIQDSDNIRIKIGTGTNFNSTPYFDAILTQSEEPTNVPDGTLWLDPDSENEHLSGLPAVTTNDNGKTLKVVNGLWDLVNAGDSDKHKVESYYTLSQIGLSGIVTTLQVFTAMPSYSQLVFLQNASAANYISDAPYTYGNAIFWKNSSTRGNAIFVNSDGTSMWFGAWYSSSGFAGWNLVPKDADKVSKAGDTMTGALTTTRLQVKTTGGGYATVQLLDPNSSAIAVIGAPENSHTLYLQNYCLDTSYKETFYTPNPSAERTSDGSYSILTSKNAVTVEQGGTGAITAEDACENLGAVQVSGDTMTGNLILNGGYLASKALGMGYRGRIGDVQYINLRPSTEGTTSTVGIAQLTLGNATASGTAGNARGLVQIYGSDTGYINIYAPAVTTRIDCTLPSTSGTLLNLQGGTLATGKVINTRLNIAKGTTPSSTVSAYSCVFDSSGTTAADRLAMVYNYVDTSNVNHYRLYCYKPTSGSTDTAYFYLQYSADGVAKAGTSCAFYGAVWNDYAEYRQSEVLEPGRVICETGKGDLVLSTERLQPGANVVSDTFGFAIGETDESKTPIAVSGRVLVYPYEDRYSYAAGDAVCAGPGGTVSKMSREEIRNYPDRIVGTVSEIPEYDTWGTGNAKVNGRIWIKVR